jgi:hypothetical protein
MMYVSSSASYSSKRNPFNTRADSSGVQLRLIQDLYGLAHDRGPRGEATLGGVRRALWISFFSMTGVFVCCSWSPAHLLSVSGTLSVLHLAIILIVNGLFPLHPRPRTNERKTWPAKPPRLLVRGILPQHGECTWHVCTYIPASVPCTPPSHSLIL